MKKKINIVASKNELINLIHEILSVVVDNKEIDIKISGYNIIVKSDKNE